MASHFLKEENYVGENSGDCVRRGIILKSLSGFYYVEDSESGKVVTCRARGVFRKDDVKPVVGDCVKFTVESDGSGYVMEVMTRKNSLVRPPIANVDVALVVFSAKEPDFSVKLLDRLLAVVEFKQILPVIIVTKMDLLCDDEFEAKRVLLAYYKGIGYEVFETSAESGVGVDEVIDFLSGRTFVVCGQSGVGKSSLLNAMDGSLDIEVSEISKALGRGKHTTRHVELHKLGSALIADAPGFSALDLDELEASDLREAFIEFVALQDGCKFRGCLHVNEPSCAVKGAVDSGEVLTMRYENYLKFLGEIQDRKPQY